MSNVQMTVTMMTVGYYPIFGKIFECQNIQIKLKIYAWHDKEILFMWNWFFPIIITNVLSHNVCMSAVNFDYSILLS